MSAVTPNPPAPPEGALMTAEELLAAGDLGRCELLDGKLVGMAPTGFEHGHVELNIGSALKLFARARRSGWVMSGDVGFVLGRNPDRVRAPDVAFVTRERLPTGPPKGFIEGPPDLAVEVVSAGDLAGDVLQKTREWLSAGARQVWVLDPESQTVSVYFPDGAARVLGVGEELDGGELLPGFRVAVAELFE